MAVDKALKESKRANNRLDVAEKEKVSWCSVDGIVNTAVKRAMEAGGGSQLGRFKQTTVRWHGHSTAKQRPKSRFTGAVIDTEKSSIPQNLLVQLLTHLGITAAWTHCNGSRLACARWAVTYAFLTVFIHTDHSRSACFILWLRNRYV